MKAKVTRGGGFRGALNYVLDEGPKATGDKHPEVVGGNLAGATSREMSREFEAVRRLRPDIAKPVWHCSLSLPPGDEKLSAEKWDSISRDFMQQMGFPTDTPYTAVRHQDTDKDHIHIVASRVSLSGEVWLGRWEARRAIEATQELEKKHGLTLTPGLGDARAEKKALTANELNMADRTGEEPPRRRLQRLCDEALEGNKTALEFAEYLQAAGVSVRPNIASGKMNGFGFKIDGIKFTGQDLGAGYKWAGLQKRGLTYDKDRESEGLERLRAAATDHKNDADVAADHTADERQNIAAPGNNIERDIQSPGAFESDQYRAEELAVDDIDRDSAGVEAIAADQEGVGEFAPIDCDRDDQSFGAVEPDQPGAAEPPGSDSDRSDDGLGASTIDQPGREESDSRLRADQPGPAPDAGHLDERAADADSRAIEADHGQRGNNRRHEDDSRNDGHEHRDGDREDRRSSNESIQHSTREQAEVVEASPGVADRGDYGRSTRDDWSSRFRKANAARRVEAERGMGANSVEQSDRNRTKITEQDRVTARELDPTPYLEASGYTVKREGRHLSAQVQGDEIYRITLKPDGHFVTCDKYGNGIGDNIDLVRELEPGTKFTEAIYKLNGAPSVEPQQRPAVPARKPPVMPHQGPIQRHYGREYLQSRGISLETINHAEASGMLQYADKAVLFVGLDRDGKAQNVTRRAIKESDPVQKRDLKGSDKRFAPILPGDPSKVWIVEGGTDALALHDIAKRTDQPPPTVIISSGANVRSFLDNPEIQEILRRADKVTICGENEKDSRSQDRADQGHKKQADRVREITGREVHGWTPPQGTGKDLADLNERQQSEAEQNRLKMQELQRQSRDQEPDRSREQDSPGMSR